jgi:GDP-L-fucose synthase
MEKTEKILVTGAAGMVGSAIILALLAQGFSNIVGTIHRTIPDFGPEAKEKVRLEHLNLLNQQAVGEFFAKEQPRQVFLAAAKVGGIHANNTYPADFIHDNLVIQTNIIHNAYLTKVDRLLFLGSSCIYPKLCPQPIKEEYLLTGPLEETNKAYALAKIAGIEMCWAYNRQHGCRFIPVMPTNLYGENDNFDLENCHVLPALIRKFHLAKLAMQGDLTAIQRDEQRFGTIPFDFRNAIGLKNEGSSKRTHEAVNAKMVVWGTGVPKREFLHVDDLANASVFLMNRDYDTLMAACNHSGLLFNIGTGLDLAIKDLVLIVQNAVGFQGETLFDNTKPDGTPRKLLDVSRLETLGWHAYTALNEGVAKLYSWYLQNGYAK